MRKLLLHICLYLYNKKSTDREADRVESLTRDRTIPRRRSREFHGTRQSAKDVGKTALKPAIEVPPEKIEKIQITPYAENAVAAVQIHGNIEDVHDVSRELRINMNMPYAQKGRRNNVNRAVALLDEEGIFDVEFGRDGSAMSIKLTELGNAIEVRPYEEWLKPIPPVEIAENSKN